MNIRIEQLNVTVGDLKGNAALIIESLRKAEQDDIDLLMLPEMVVCGYPPMDLLERPSFLKRLFELNEELILETKSTALLIGTVTPNEKEHGRPVYNAAILAHQGKQVAEIHKSLLPTYDVFDEFRYFEPGHLFQPVEFKGTKLGITICEDIWHNFNEHQYHTYDVNPAESLSHQGMDLLLNLSASPFDKYKPTQREDLIYRHATSWNVPVLYANQVGANTELVFDGDSIACNPSGKIVGRCELFHPDYLDVSFGRDGRVVPVNQPSKDEPLERRNDKNTFYKHIFEGLVLGVRDYVTKTGISDSVLLGLSGGIDSALTAVIAKEALGEDHVIGVTMPSEFSSEGSVTDSEKLVANLGITMHEIAIRSVYDTYLNALGDLFEGTEFNVAEENLQSRSRGVLLMALSNKFGYMLLNTGNKSEMAVGYCTLYGDMAGGISVISDLYKTEVFGLSRWLNETYYGKEVIPNAIIEKPPSAELRPDQKDTDSLPEYEDLDQILKAYIEDQHGYEQIVASGFDKAIVERIIRLVDYNEYKRRQSPPGMRISSKAFGIGRRLPIVQHWTNQQFD